MKNIRVKFSLSVLLVSLLLAFPACTSFSYVERPSISESLSEKVTADPSLPSFSQSKETSVTAEKTVETEGESEAATEEAREENSVSPSRTLVVEESFAKPTEEPTFLTTEQPTELQTEAPTESKTEPPTEAETDEPTDAPTETDTESDTSSALPPEISDLARINQLPNLLAPNTSLLISYDRYDGEGKVFETYRYIYRIDAGGNLTFDAINRLPSGELIEVYNYLDGAVYGCDSDGVLSLAFIPKKEESALFTLGVDLFAQTPKGDIRLAENFLILETAYEEEGLSFDCVYLFDAENKRLLGGERTVCFEENFLFREEFTYQYEKRADAFSDSQKAYTAITSPSDRETFSLNVATIDKNGEQTDKKHYTFAKSTELSLYDGAFAFYKNSNCTADITDLQAYLSESPYPLTVYLAEKREEISFAYTLTDADFEEFENLITALEAMLTASADSAEFIELFERASEKYLYLDAQADAGYLSYCRDQYSTDAQNAYMHSSEVRSDALLLYYHFLDKIYASDSPFKEIVFAGWSEEELSDFFGEEDHNEEIYALEHENEQLSMSFYELIGNGTPPWNQSAVAALYVQLVANNQEIALLRGYDNYYNYAAKEIYGRLYTAEDRENFRLYVSTYVVPLLVYAHDRYFELANNLNMEQYLVYKDFISSPYSAQFESYLQSYINSYGGALSENMNALFEKDAAIFATGANALSSAFVSYNNYYEEPYAYFGADYQDILSIVHELGHYAALYSYSLEDLPYDLAEAHSQGSEWMFLAYLEDRLDPTVADLIVTYRLYSGLLSIVYATMVDEFEDIIYHANIPYTANQLEGLVNALAVKYGGTDLLNVMGTYTPYEYVQYVSFASPVYYLNYATSEIVSISLYLEASESYENAQLLYAALQEDAQLEIGFVENIEAMGFESPFEETLYEELCILFGVTVNVP